MKIALFTSNQPRHIALASRLARHASELFVVQECTTAFPGQVEDFYRKSDIMRDYFSRVIAAEHKVFGDPSFMPANARTMSIRIGDLSHVSLGTLKTMLACDLFIVFGSSWIKGPLLDALIERKAINLHMGLSPWYRGTACNFWALYDDRPDMVGGTIHRLSRGLDSGAILAHARPPADITDPFERGMAAVRSTHIILETMVRDGDILQRFDQATPQDKALQIRYSRNSDFTDDIAARYLERLNISGQCQVAVSS